LSGSTEDEVVTKATGDGSEVVETVWVRVRVRVRVSDDVGNGQIFG